ncbi:MAG: GntR family transcriptional regulator [Pseudomonadota bacterium]
MDGSAPPSGPPSGPPSAPTSAAGLGLGPAASADPTAEAGERRESAADHAYRSLREAILSGALAEGARLTETALGERLGVSRTPVREALNRLSLEGLVTREGGRAARVASFPEDEVEQIFQIRMLLESYAARRAATHRTGEDVVELRALADAMTERTPPRTDEDFEALSDANQRFHTAVMRAAKAQRLESLLSVTVRMGLVLRTYRMYSERDLIRSAQHHQELADAIAARAPEWAASVMTSHLLAAAAAESRGRVAG